VHASSGSKILRIEQPALLRLTLFSLLVGVAIASAQDTGEIYGKVNDLSGAALPGVMVTLTGPALLQPLTATTSRAGTYRFPRLPIGAYTITFELAGFKMLIRAGIAVEIGFKAALNATLEASRARDTITFTGASPVVDLRGISQGARYSLDALQKLPTARDPYSVLDQTPGITMERPAAGRSPSGQHENDTSRGGPALDNTWTLNGVEITDAPALARGASPIHYDYDALQQLQVVTAGMDVSQQAGGVGINIVTKGGSDTFRGSARFYVTDQRFEANNVDESLRKQGASSGNPVQNIQDYGLEAGGPIRKGRAWLWGAAARQRIKVGILNFFEKTSRCAAISASPANYPIDVVQGCLKPDLTTLSEYGLRSQLRPFGGNTLSWFNDFAERIRDAREASDLRPAETTWRQRGASSAFGTPLWTTGPTGTWKAGDRHIFSDRLLAEFQLAHTGNNFTLDLQSAELETVQPSYEITTGLWGRSYERQGPYLRPADSVKVTFDYFLPSFLHGEHSIEAGYRWRAALANEQSHWGGNAVARYRDGAPADAILYRDSVARFAYDAQAAWVQDAFSWKRLTVSLGLRWDRQHDAVRASSVPAHPFQGLMTAQGVPFRWLPAVSFGGADPRVVWDDVSPRFVATYDLTGSGRSVVKLSAARYYGQSGAGNLSSTLNPVTTASIRFPWTDANGDRTVQVDELDTTRILSFGGNYDPYEPGALGTPNTVDSRVRNQATGEVIVAFDKEIGREFAVGASYIWREYGRFLWTRPVGIDSGQWVKRTFTPSPAACPEGARCPTVEYWEPTIRLPAVVFLTNHPDFNRAYHGFEITARKRFAGRWMLNGSVTYNDARSHYKSPRAYVDPTNIDRQNDAPAQSDATWLVKIAGACSLPWWDVGVSGFYQARQGLPFMQAVQTPDRVNSAGQVMVLLDPMGAVHLPALQSLDLHVDKALRAGLATITGTVDIFNLANANTILGRQRKQNATNANQVSTILAPRVVRLGVRMTW
jgi:hypothetical protein